MIKSSTVSDSYDLINRIQKWGLMSALVGGVLSIISFLWNREHFFQSYLVSFFYWTGLPIGCMVLTCIHNLTGGLWGKTIKPVLVAGARTIPFMAILFLPLIAGMQKLYPWLDADAVAHSTILQHKAIYLSGPWFLIRAVIYFAIWIAFAFTVTKRYRDDDHRNSPQLLSGLGLVILSFAASFAAIDWVMSLEPEWFSTIYGLIYLTASVLCTFSLSVIVIGSTRPYLVPSGHGQNPFHDVGNLMLAFTMLWTYMSVSQLIIIWHANLPEEITWYIHRSTNGWQYVISLIALVCFVTPFMLLLQRPVKKAPKNLMKVAVWIMAMHFLHVIWFVKPSFDASPAFRLSDPATFLLIGGLWLFIAIPKIKTQLAEYR